MRLSKKLSKYDQMPDTDGGETQPRIVAYKNKAYIPDDQEPEVVHTRSVHNF